MTYVKYIVVFVICAGCFAGGIFTERCTSVPIERIRIVEKLKQVTKYVTMPTTCEDFKECFYQEIMIDGKVVEQVYFLVTATDNCKLTERKFKMDGTAKINPNLMLINYVHMFNFQNSMMDIGGSLSYYRILYTGNKFNFGLGGGATVTNHSAGLQLGGIFQF